MSETPASWVPALGRIPSGLSIITARHGDATTGMLASWVQQCSFEPPMVSFAIRQGRPVGEWLQVGAAFTINLLADDQKKLIGHFGKGFALDQPAFEGLNIRTEGNSAPILNDSLAYLLCRVTGRVLTGDHELILGSVHGGALQMADAKPMVHVRKSGLHY
ncbi:flavin reductase family protein [Tuwongella immobilis]|uniref:Flavin reductase like domain-containing protein n=1 Tax=Tuwongella immobilis TaxID=692036 RepID=A0A6C2YM69_9BACT|nr:flavin reductase family protein [Tuwongella immobilis]VIP02319.1 faimly transcriptional regulator : Conserved protein/domain typically associated with flavoprotein oxygenases, DIM6/NTAB family OS=Chloracidobacterium thermophilum (strain B) GN=Cabther_A0991 PE=4 SV=1: Flavin_Reduct [Tuwongella immobilis]VTS01043.1 faimly transcriptional regulator : Conserved protein/domain typically associated with flavoprotein oxygenases, DIM6/NTAB family OS=Chloracidobacterium thermophilum (strain B) GN=Cabth